MAFASAVLKGTVLTRKRKLLSLGPWCSSVQERDVTLPVGKLKIRSL
jgi:hypothetical protein